MGTKTPPTSTGVLAARHVGECGDPPEATRRVHPGFFCCPFLCFLPMVLLQNHVETTVFLKHVVERVHRKFLMRMIEF